MREAYLQQNGLHEVDRYSPPEKTYRILQGIKTYHDEAFDALDAGVPVDEIQSIDAAPRLNRVGTTPDDEADEFVAEIEEQMKTQLRELY